MTSENLEGCLVLEPRETFDRAIVGVTRNPKDDWTRNTNTPCVIYSREGCIQALVEVDGMDYEEAAEFVDFNTIGAWMGEGTPTFVD